MVRVIVSVTFKITVKHTSLANGVRVTVTSIIITS
jgi:hypothetical protein